MIRFPYSIYFTLNQRRIFVIAVDHQHRLDNRALIEGAGWYE